MKLEGFWVSNRAKVGYGGSGKLNSTIAGLVLID